MCYCKDIQIWTYDNQIYIPFNALPDHMKVYVANQYKRIKWICIDSCVLWEVSYLWSKWITTTWCCCGHNDKKWYIWVIEEDIQSMIYMWYEIDKQATWKGNFFCKTF